jgi:hypothetical protein
MTRDHRPVVIAVAVCAAATQLTTLQRLWLAAGAPRSAYRVVAIMIGAAVLYRFRALPRRWPAPGHRPDSSSPPDS